MDISALRSSLQHACPELRNLTTAELQEGKWLTKKKVLQQLIACAPTLSEENDQLTDLGEQRNEESAAQKRAGVAKEERVEAESTFRTKFMRAVLQALTKLKWPPSQEAFSDPLDSLFNDVSVFLDAVRFLVRVAVPVSHDHSYRSSPPRSESDPTFTPPKRPSSGSRQRPSSTLDTSLISAISHVPSASEYPAQDGTFYTGGMEFGPSKKKASTAPTAPDDSYFSQRDQTQPPPSSRMSDFGDLAATPAFSKERKLEVNWKAFELLQRQNEVLSGRLRDLQLSVLRRDEVEAKIAGILVELKNTVGEIVEAGGGKQTSAGVSSRTAARDGSVVRGPDAALAMASGTAPTEGGLKDGVSVAEMEEFRREVEREKAESEAKKNTTLGSTVASSAGGKGSSGVKSGVKGVAEGALCTACSAKLGAPVKAATPSFSGDRDQSSSVMWGKVHQRLRAMEEQWNGAQRSAKRLAEGHHSHTHGGNSPPPAGLRPKKSPGGPHGGGGSSSGAGGVLYASSMTPSKSLVHSTLGVHPSLLRGAAAQDVDPDLFASPLQPPGGAGGRMHYDGAGSEVHNFGLDLTRLHLLQRDLVKFAERAFALTATSAGGGTADEGVADGEETSFTAGIGHGRRRGAGAQPMSVAPQRSAQSALGSAPNALPMSSAAARRQEDLWQLQGAAWELVLHLSSVAHAAPLAMGSSYRSCVTGLEALLQEVSYMLSGGCIDSVYSVSARSHSWSFYRVVWPLCVGRWRWSMMLKNYRNHIV
jgi:hypothetical protein